MIKYGTVLNDTYEIIGEIGAGGGGVVYEARHLRLDTGVVVKRIRDEVRGKIESRKEADVLKRLKHPYLPRVYDFIEREDGVYTIMDYIPGTSLDKLLKEKKEYSQKQVLKWAEQLGEALAYLHSQNPPIIHSDIKPANIIITPEGNVCLIDFNISMAIEGDTSLSMGISAGYSAPEQYGRRYFEQLEKAVAKAEGEDRTEILSEEEDATELLSADEDATELLGDTDLSEAPTVFQGAKTGKTETVTESRQITATEKTNLYEGGYVDTCSDIYSLGCVLYHMMAGIAPARDFKKIIPISETNAKISEGFAVIIEKMMQQEPKNRYKDGSRFLEAVRNCYKLDRRYIVHKRKERALLFCAAVLFLSGAALVGTGLRKMELEKFQRYESRIMEADVLAERGNYEEALEGVRELQSEEGLRESYERELYYLYLASDYQGCLARGEEILRLQLVMPESEEEDKTMGDVYYLMANASFEEADYENALTYMRTALAYYQGNALYYRDYCVILAKMGQREAASDALAAAEQMGLGEDSVYFARGELFAAAGDTEKAVEAFQKTMSSTTDSVLKKRSVLLCAQAYREENRSEEEAALLEQALAQADNQERLVLMEYLAAVYMRIGDNTRDGELREKMLGKALQMFEELLNNGYVTWQTRENIAILREETGNLEGARSMLEQMLEDYPTDYRIYKRLTFLEADVQQYVEESAKDYGQMKEYYEKAVELYESRGADDVEMQMLSQMVQELSDGGWFRE